MPTSNIQFLEMLLLYWSEGFQFKKNDSGDTFLIRGEDILSQGKSIDEAIIQLRLSFSDDYLENKIRSSSKKSIDYKDDVWKRLKTAIEDLKNGTAEEMSWDDFVKELKDEGYHTNETALDAFLSNMVNKAINDESNERVFGKKQLLSLLD